MKKYLILIAIAILGIGSWLYLNPVFGGDVSKDNSTPTDRFQNYDFFKDSKNLLVTSTTTSAVSTAITPYFASSTTQRLDNGYFVIAGAENVTFYFTRGWGGTNTGTSTFTVQVTKDGTNWYEYKKLIVNTTNANSTNLTRVSDVVLTASTNVAVTGTLFGSATSTEMLSMSPEDTFFAARCTVVEVTDGTHTCSASAEW